MDESSVTDSGPSSSSPFVSSVLGVKGPLRFRPHHYSQRAHVCLRRVEFSSDSSDEGEDTGVVYFSLFAHKRIDVKPGKEILLTVANGRFKDKPILLQGIRADFDGSSEDEGIEDVVDVPKKKPASPAPATVIPPKMRRAWTKKNEESPPGNLPPPVPRHTDVGVQVEPFSESVAIQVQPELTSDGVQTEEHKSSVSTQTWISTTSTSVQVDIHPDDSEASSKSNQRLPEDKSGSLNRQTERKRDQSRSLSPMELDSPTESPPDSPVFTPTSVPALIANLSPSMLPQAMIARGSDDDDSMQVVSVGKNESPSLLLDPVKPPHTSDGNVIPSLHDSSSPELPSINVSSQNLCPECSLPKECHREDAPASPPATISQLGIKKKVQPVRPKRRPIANPFVSAGFVTEFVGESRLLNESELVSTSTKSQEVHEPVAPKTDPKVENSRAESSPVSPVEVAPQKRSDDISKPVQRRSPSVGLKEVATSQVSSSHPSLPQKRSASPPRPSALPPTAPRSNLPAKQPPSQPRAFRNHLNAVASSSKQTLDRLGSKQIPSMPLSLRAREKSPAEPLPDPQSVAYISSGPMGNSLSIKPSKHVQPTAIPAGPRALTDIPAKKKVVIGTGWRPNKGSQTIGKTLTPRNLVSDLKTSAPSQLPYLDSYSAFSPSSTPPPLPPPPEMPPPPSPTPPPVPVSSAKWKRVGENLGHLTSSSCIQKESGSLPDRISLEELPKKTAKESQTQKAGQTHSEGRSPTSPVPRPDTINDTPASSQYNTQHEPSASKHDTHQAARTSNIETTPHIPSTANNSSGVIGNSTSRPPPISTSRVHHPLPPKPIFAEGKRGVKRKSPGALDHHDRAEPMSTEARRTFKWPTLRATHSVSLKGTGSVAVLGLALNEDGTCLAMYCADKTVRIWDNVKRTEMARLSHNTVLLSLSWVDDEKGIMVLGQDGIVSKWTKTEQNHWNLAKVIDTGDDPLGGNSAPSRMVYQKNYLAVSFPLAGVKVWTRSKDSWKAQKSIVKQNVSALMFMVDGCCLLGGTKDGMLWSYDVSNETLRARAFLKAEITKIDLSPVKNEALVAHVGGVARLINLNDEKAEVIQTYSTEDTVKRSNGGFGAIFVARGQGVLFGSVHGCGLIWDLKRGSPPVYGLEHWNEEEAIEAAAGCEAVGSGGAGCMITGTRSGILSWWSQPAYTPQGEGASKRARMV